MIAIRFLNGNLCSMNPALTVQAGGSMGAVGDPPLELSAIVFRVV